MATHSSVLAWRILGTESLVGCRLWGHTESDTTEAAAAAAAAAEAVHRYQKGLEQSGRITQVTVNK